MIEFVLGCLLLAALALFVYDQLANARARRWYERRSTEWARGHETGQRAYLIPPKPWYVRRYDRRMAWRRA